uniref:LY6/PLAUR domain containing 6B n=1 Tax=Junco hyemalis TaxID=40217 RepID=A0A8C5IHL1_JUNHY
LLFKGSDFSFRVGVQALEMQFFHQNVNISNLFLFKCFTCDNAVDNYNCNRWAEDRWCPEKLFLMMASDSRIAFCGGINYRELMTLLSRQECVSCCEGMICNVEIPTNATNAVLAVLQARRAAAGSRALPDLGTLLALLVTPLVTMALS